MLGEKELEKIKQLLDSAENNIRQAKSLIFSAELTKKTTDLESDSSDDTVEGVFDGEKMIGKNEKQYQIPVNYASKSKLVAGDLLKLTILADGSFQFKQIGPIERKKLIGTLKAVGQNKYIVETDEGEFQVLSASVTYFKAKDGDKLTVLIPENGLTEWAAVENLIDSK